MSVIPMTKTDAQSRLKVVTWIYGQSANKQIKQVYKLLCKAMIHKHKAVKILRRERSLPLGHSEKVSWRSFYLNKTKKWVEFLVIAAAWSGWGWERKRHPSSRVILLKMQSEKRIGWVLGISGGIFTLVRLSELLEVAICCDKTKKY